MRAICEVEPEKPSTAVSRPRASEVTDDSATAILPSANVLESRKLRRVLAGDLDNIVLKALRKEPKRRYVSVEQFSEDIRRHLAHLPVFAHKDTLGYRARKFVGRNRLGVAAVTLVILSLTAGLATTLHQARIARFERARAERRFNDVRALANSLIFDVHDSIRSLPGATSTRKLVLQRAQEYLDSLAPDANSDPSLLRELAAAYIRLGNVLGDPLEANLGSTEQSLHDYRRGIELRKAVVAASPTADNQRELAESYMSLAVALSQNKANADQEFLGPALAILQPLAASNPNDLKVQYTLAKVFERRGQALMYIGKLERAIDDYQKSLHAYENLAQADPQNSQYQVDLAFAHKHFGGALIRQNELQPALDEYRAALPFDEAQIKADPRNANNRYAITYTYSDIGFILGKQGNIDAALASYRKAFDIRKELAAADPQDVRARAGLAMTYNYIARLLWQKGDLKAALEDEKEALTIREALSQTDAANQSKQLNVAFSEGSVGETYVKMAFLPHTSVQRRLALCQEAVFWLHKALPELQQRRTLIEAGDAQYPAVMQQAIDRCNTVILVGGEHAQHRGPTTPR
jgi:non-specific serine/threonine protein kinase/serine/threonine-protein kinase